MRLPWAVGMPDERSTLYILAAVAVVAVVGLGLAVASIATHDSFQGMMNGGGSGMMGGGPSGTTSSPGILEWTVLAVSVVFFTLAVLLLLRGRQTRLNLPDSGPVSAVSPSPPAVGSVVPARAVAPQDAPLAGPATPSPAPVAEAPAPVPEPTLVKLLGEDERRMYLEIRGHGGEMLQRDLVALGLFSKAKVTRVLDKLEAKGLVVREAHGMTNRVRLTGGVAR